MSTKLCKTNTKNTNLKVDNINTENTNTEESGNDLHLSAVHGPEEKLSIREFSVNAASYPKVNATASELFANGRKRRS
jgi:hypothetical protein